MFLERQLHCDCRRTHYSYRYFSVFFLPPSQQLCLNAVCFVNPRRHYSKSKRTRIDSRIGSRFPCDPTQYWHFHIHSQRVPDFDLSQICLVFIAVYHLSPVEGRVWFNHVCIFCSSNLYLVPRPFDEVRPQFPLSRLDSLQLFHISIRGAPLTFYDSIG